MLRSLLYGFGCWTGGIFMTLLVLALLGGSVGSAVFWAIVSFTLAAGLATAFYSELRATSARSVR